MRTGDTKTPVLGHRGFRLPSTTGAAGVLPTTREPLSRVADAPGHGDGALVLVEHLQVAGELGAFLDLDLDLRADDQLGFLALVARGARLGAGLGGQGRCGGGSRGRRVDWLVLLPERTFFAPAEEPVFL